MSTAITFLFDLVLAVLGIITIVSFLPALFVGIRRGDQLVTARRKGLIESMSFRRNLTAIIMISISPLVYLLVFPLLIGALKQLAESAM
ncbi:hypothetical protein NBM05_14925 [Rothia sp. AR01]|uniref:Uncharacterized protein n=1 Tax=Rothia santali TaxID=2949643 RepID=A0A9X2HLR5_9MICC|nr:hypothetical protein [Rothia santali]MCP3427263.1 hypothetical protein [Rothia santali]